MHIGVFYVNMNIVLVRPIPPFSSTLRVREYFSSLFLRSACIGGGRERADALGVVIGDILDDLSERSPRVRAFLGGAGLNVEAERKSIVSSLRPGKPEVCVSVNR